MPRSCLIPCWDLALRLSLLPCRPGWSNLLLRCRTGCRHVRAPGFPPCPRCHVPAHALGHWCRVRGGPLTCPNAGHGLPNNAATTPWLKLLDPSNTFVDRTYLPPPPFWLHYFTYRVNECAARAHVLCCVGVCVCVLFVSLSISPPPGSVPATSWSRNRLGNCPWVPAVPTLVGVCRTSSESHRSPSGIRSPSEVCLMAATQRESICGAPQRVVFLVSVDRTRWPATHLNLTESQSKSCSSC